jgi:hypothetical protein
MKDFIFNHSAGTLALHPRRGNVSRRGPATDGRDAVGNLPQRPLLTPEAARATPLRTLLERVDTFNREHPDIKIAAPYTTFSKLWEVRDASGTSQWDNGFRMMDFLEQRYEQ